MSSPAKRTPPILMHEFSATLNGLHQLVDTVAPHAANLKNSPISVEIDLNEEREKEFVSALQSLSTKQRDKGPLPPERVEKFIQETQSAFTEDPEGLRSLGMALLMAGRTPSQQELLYRALLAMCIASLEVLIAGLVAYRYQEHKGALSGREVKLSMQELEDFAALSDVQEYVVSREVDRVMFGGLETWSKWLVEHANLKLEDLAPNYDQLFEAFQRRHAIVHNGGRASRIYRAKLKTRKLKSPNLDESLVVDAEYLQKVLTELKYVGLAISACTWAKWQPSENALLEVEFKRYVDEAIEDSDWATTSRLAETGLDLVKKESGRCHLRLGKALATKRLEGLDAAKRELDGWDTSAVDRKIQMAVAALEEDFDRLFRLVDEIDTTRPSHVSWLRNPVFEEARQDPRWKTDSAKEIAS
jgi:hypothetical protein